MRPLLLAAATACFLVFALRPGTALAGTYDVTSCGDPDSHQMSGQSGYPAGWGFSEYAPGSGNWRTFASCSSWGGGFGFQTNTNGGSVPYPQWGQLSFSPPADTSVSEVRLARAARRPNANPFVVPMLASDSIAGAGIDWCHTYWSSCTVGDYAHPSSSANLVDVAGGGSTWFQLYCDGSQGCPRDGQATWWVFGARITLLDANLPTFSSAPAGGLVTSSILTGSSSVTVSSADRGGGLLRAELLAGSQVVASSSFDTNGRCNTSFRIDLVPCPLSGSRTLTLNSTTLADGGYAMSVRLTDVGGNQASSALGIKTVDNHAPAQVAVSVDGGEGWRATNSFSASWTNSTADAGSPIAEADYKICSTGQSPTCTNGSQAGTAIHQLTGLSVPAAGDYTLQVWLKDQAGNVDAGTVSAPVHLRWDQGTPGSVRLGTPGSYWLGAQGATTYSEQLQPASAVPASGIAGYAVTVDGSVPGTSVTVAADGQGNARYGPPAGGWPEGAVTIKARAIAGNGQAGPVGQTTLHVDRTAPATGALGTGNGSDPQPGPITVTLHATDAGSGMGGADPDQPLESGGYIAYTLDGGGLQKVRGGSAKVTVSGDGLHTLVVRAYDVAGNVSTDRTVAVSLGPPGGALAFTGLGFTARSTNPNASFTAAPSFGSSCPAQATLTPSRDTYVDAAQPASSFVTAAQLVVRSAAGQNARALLGFNLPAANGCVVTAATLRLHAGGSTRGRTLAAYRLGSAWDETVTWSTRPGASGDPALAESIDSGWVSFDLTGVLQDVYRYGDNGLVVRDANEGARPAAGQAFDASEGDPALRPQLIVSFG